MPWLASRFLPAQPLASPRTNLSLVEHATNLAETALCLVELKPHFVEASLVDQSRVRPISGEFGRAWGELDEFRANPTACSTKFAHHLVLPCLGGDSSD